MTFKMQSPREVVPLFAWTWAEQPLSLQSSSNGQEQTKASPYAARIDDVLTIIQMQFESLPPGPKFLAGDFHERPEVFATIITLTAEYGWADVGIVVTPCKDKLGQYTCHANDKAKESRIDVGQCDAYATCRPLIIDVDVGQ